MREVFEESPFLVPEDSVSIMDGSYEGMFLEGGKSERKEELGKERDTYYGY